MNTTTHEPIVRLAQSVPGYMTISAAVSWPAGAGSDTEGAESTGRLLICSCLEQLKKLGMQENAVIRTRIRMSDPAFWPILAAIRHELMARSRAVSTFEIDCDDSTDDHLVAEFDAVTRAA